MTDSGWSLHTDLTPPLQGLRVPAFLIPPTWKGGPCLQTKSQPNFSLHHEWLERHRQLCPSLVPTLHTVFVGSAGNPKESPLEAAEVDMLVSLQARWTLCELAQGSSLQVNSCLPVFAIQIYTRNPAIWSFNRYQQKAQLELHLCWNEHNMRFEFIESGPVVIMYERPASETTSSTKWKLSDRKFLFLWTSCSLNALKHSRIKKHLK